MKIAILTFSAGAMVLVLSLNAQMAPAKPDPVEQLQQIRATNVRLLKEQEATLTQLEELKETARQLKIFSKRS